MKDSHVLKFLRRKFGGRFALTPPHRCECVPHEGECYIREVIHRHIVKVSGCSICEWLDCDFEK